MQSPTTILFRSSMVFGPSTSNHGSPGSVLAGAVIGSAAGFVVGALAGEFVTPGISNPSAMRLRMPRRFSRSPPELVSTIE